MGDSARPRIRDLLSGQGSERTCPWPAELEQLERCLQDSGPVVAWVHGPVGSGKTSLLAEFSTHAQSAGATLFNIDCRLVEPTAAGMLGAVSEFLAQTVDDVETAAARLAECGSRVVMTLDNYEVFRLADTWLRREFIPALDAGARVVLVSSEPPAAGWISAGEWRGLFVAIPLGPVTGIGPEQRATALLDTVAPADLGDSLEAVSVVRRTTRPMLAALCPESSADELYARLAGLPFIEGRRDGLVLQDMVRKVIGTRLQAGDPERYRHYQRAAWKVLREQLRQASHADLWRFTADVIYLIENPVIREAFFPSESAQFSVEPAMPGDRRPLMDMVSRHESPAAREALELWWKHLPAAFHVIRDASGSITGFYCMAKPDEAGDAWMRFDPVARNWQRHLFGTGSHGAAPSLFLRRWLSDADGESPCPTQAAAWVDIKRTYLELRPELRRVYLTLQDIGPYGPAATELGFRVLDEYAAKLGDAVYHTAMLDFGPGSVDGWICDLVAAELGIGDDRLLDTASRELILDGDRIPLTPLEFGVVAMLESHAGEAVSRAELLQQVWGHGHDGGSNVVDAVMRGLRRKCGEKAMIFETVRGVGYRLRA